jgi:broad specificity phosphatase PhoE
MQKIFIILLFFGSSSYSLAQSKQETIIFLVRHAAKSMESSDNPSLSAKGKQQAEKLANLLSDAEIEAIYSTDTKRTKETAEPLAQKLTLPVTLYDAKNKNFPADLLKKHAGKKILLVGHSNTLPDFLNAFSRSQSYKPSEAYGDLYMIILKKPKQAATILKLWYDEQ